jgi:ribosomal protein S7
MTNVTPQVEVRSRRVGGANFQIPQPVREDRKVSLAMKWLIGYSRGRNERSMAQKLANEIMAAAKEEGAASRRKKKFTRWPRRTRRSATSASKPNTRDRTHGPRSQIHAQHRHHGAH